MASAPTYYTATALSDDDGSLINEDDDDLSLDGLEENDDNLPLYYTGILCVVSNRRMHWMSEIP